MNRVDVDAQQPRDVLPLAHPEDVVHARVFFLHLAAVELGHAPGHYQQLSVPLARRELFDRLHRLFLALFDEAAGVDDDGVRFTRLDHRQEFAAGEQALQVFAIDVVLGTPECHQVVGLRYCHY